ncbi:hypothetical protein CI105_03020 [Candidatus Izimaplasma bacterium ZiA1]|uniref:MerR family transcriptional regulator n=1 Tax=Candidatus Izimoplasma sp. ZiA1 TaxID=2024899 RepID=UPI000BAA76FA|nr:hypothetical protein CI105_03020 [Candidatus Izimaplasma bacterium ZiA1]
MYSINDVSKLTGLTKRTLRHYHSIGLLVPKQDLSNQYRIYNDKDLLKIQDILLFKKLNYSLESIIDITGNPNFDKIASLENQSLEIDKRIDDLVLIKKNIRNTIKSINRGIKMKNEKLFEDLKEKNILDNENKYGKELRKRHGDNKIDASNNFYQKQSKANYEYANKLAEKIKVLLVEALKTDDIKSSIAVELAENHQKWIMAYWPSYSKEAHIGLVDMYLEDERFKKYYEDIIEGGTLFLNQAIKNYLK